MKTKLDKFNFMTSCINNNFITILLLQDNVKAAFDLNNLYSECKSNPLKKKKEITEGHAKAE